MAAPSIKNKRSSVAGKTPTTTDLAFGEIGLNTYDGKVFISASNAVVGVGTTIITVNPWSVGIGSTAYNTYFNAGNVGIGTTNPQQKLDVLGTTLTSNGDIIQSSHINGPGAYYYLLRKSRGSLTSPLTVITDEALGGLQGGGYDGTSYNYTSGLHFTVDGAVSTGNVPIAIDFRTGGGNRVNNTKLSITSGGDVLIGTISTTGTASQRLQVTGGAYVSGNVGIATTNPQQKLHVLGNVLVAAGSSTDQHITQKPYELNNGTLSWEGSAGQLFSITNNLSTGSIFSVNDISGIPSIDVDAGGAITLGAYGGNIGVGTTNPTSKLHVIGDTLVTGGAYVSGNIGVGLTNPTSTLHVVGNALITGITTLGTTSISGQLQSTQANSTTTGGGQIYLNGATGNRIDFNTNGVAAPAFTTRSAGTKLVLYPAVSVSLVDFAVGIDTNTLWSSVPESRQQFKWYAGITTVATLKGTGEFLLGIGNSTGTTNQRLQVTGGAYVSSNVGIAVTSPSFAADISGDARVQSTGKMRFGGTAGTTNFYIQYNSTTNSLDFVAG